MAQDLTRDVGTANPIYSAEGESQGDAAHAELRRAIAKWRREKVEKTLAKMPARKECLTCHQDKQNHFPNAQNCAACHLFRKAK